MHFQNTSVHKWRVSNSGKLALVLYNKIIFLGGKKKKSGGFSVISPKQCASCASLSSFWSSVEVWEETRKQRESRFLLKGALLTRFVKYDMGEILLQCADADVGGKM